jgi:hypothetical protein
MELNLGTITIIAVVLIFVVLQFMTKPKDGGKK